MGLIAFDTAQEALTQWSRTDIKKYKVAVYRLKSGKFLAFVAASSQIPKDAERVKPQPAYPRDKDPRQGTKQAMQKLEAKHTTKVDWACHIAVDIAKKNLTVHSRTVRDEMERRGLLEDSAGAEHWLGAAMNKLAGLGILKKSGHSYKYSDSSRGIHERTVTIWELVDGADTEYYEEPPADG